MNKRFSLGIAVIVFAVAIVAGSFLLPAPAVQGAPHAIPTPITQSPRTAAPKVINFWSSATGLTSDTRSCVNIAGYNTLDLHYVIDQGTVNTTTLTLQFSNISGAYVNGLAVVTANAADTADLKQYNVFGNEVCLYADVVNSNAWTITAVGIAK
jgi:hypothetical protein